MKMSDNVLLDGKRNKLLIYCIFAIIALSFCVFPFLISNNTYIYADSVSYSIIDKNPGVLINSGEKTSFTPINTQTGMRFGDENSNCRAYAPTLNLTYENGSNIIKYMNQSVDLSGVSLDNIVIDYSKAMLKFWVYFDSIKARDFNLVLSMTDGDSIMWSVNHQNLLSLIGNGDINKGTGWSLIGLEFSSGIVNEGGDIYDETTLKLDTIDSLQIIQQTSVENNNEVEMIFYEIQISEENVQSGILIFEKQPYFYYNLENAAFFDNINSQMNIGDVWQIPNIAISDGSFAWYGKQNLINSLFIVINNDQTNKTKVGEVYTFQTSGQININLCGNLTDNKLIVFPEFHKIINVVAFIPIHFSITSLRAVIGNNYEVTIIINKKLTGLENLRISTSSDIISLSEIDADNKFTVTANKNGDAIITVEFSAIRNGVLTEYSKDIEVNVSDKNLDRDTIAIIVCLIVIAGVIIVGVFVGIKSIKNANKYKVK